MISLNIQQILDLLPHRYPMILVDRVLECEPHKSLLAIKNVSANEPFFQGHFPNRPIMPGVLILEALAQATGLLCFYSLSIKPDDHTVYYLVGVDKARFKQPVLPGDQLTLDIKLTREIRGIYRFDAVAKVGEEVAASAEIMTTKAELVIDPRSIVHENAKIGDNVTMGPWSMVDENVEIGAGTWIGPHVIIKGPTRIGKNNRIFQFSSIGDESQDKKYKGEAETYLEIGDNNTIREYCTINRGTVQGGNVTRVGDNNWIMAYVHIAHDCIVGSNTVFANNASLAGHVLVEDYAILGGFTLIHQFCRIGAYGFSAISTVITKDIPPFTLVAENPAKPFGLNREGLRRNGFSQEKIETLRQAYKIVYRQNLTVDQSLEKLKDLEKDCSEVGHYIEFISKSTRGIVR